MNKETAMHSQPIALRRADDREQMLDKRSVLIGLGIVLCVFVVAAVWQLAVVPEKKQPKLREFEFSPEPPKEEKIEIKDPQREIMKQLVQDIPEMDEEKRPNIQMSTNPQEVQFQEDVVKASAMEMKTDVDVKINKLDIKDNMEMAEEVSTEVVAALDPMAVLVNEPADIFSHADPEPVMNRKRALVSTAPKPATTVKLAVQQLGDQDIPTVGELGPVDINMFGDGSEYGGLKRGGIEMRTAVDAALRWLALHQEPDGSWTGGDKWNLEDAPFDTLPIGNISANLKNSPKDKAASGAQPSVAMTAFALIAQMGGGHNLRRGEYRTHVIRGMEWLMAQQDPATGYLSANMYEHAIATIALCEALGRSPDERVGLAARKAVDACVAGVAKDGGWRYQPNSKDSDMSVSGWFLQALKTAKLANIRFDHSIFSRGLLFLDQATDNAGIGNSSGAVFYQPVGYGPIEAESDSKANPTPSLTCAGMVVRQFNGMGVKHPLLVRGAELTKALPPDWDKKKDFYYWYYATFAMHNMGGEYRLWWTRRIRDVLLEHQSKRGHQTGSWNPKEEKWGKSRVYTTALGALCLEVHDRYGEALQSFGTVPSVEELFFRK